jgi:hypothetical protein
MIMTNKQIAALLRKAADYHLSPDWRDFEDEHGNERCEFICHALEQACGGFRAVYQGDDTAYCTAKNFLTALGMPLSGSGFSHIDKDEGDDDDMTDEAPVEMRQQMRFTWLHFAADRAEEGFTP